MSRLTCVLGAVLLVSGSTALGHEGATGIVKQRMDDMKAIGRAMKRVDERLKARRGLPEIATDADAIGAAAIRMPSLFPAGSRDGLTEATAAVWEKWPEFVAASRGLAEESEKLANAARSGHEAALSGHFRSVARACSGCHNVFRAKQ